MALRSNTTGSRVKRVEINLELEEGCNTYMGHVRPCEGQGDLVSFGALSTRCTCTCLKSVCNSKMAGHRALYAVKFRTLWDTSTDHR